MKDGESTVGVEGVKVEAIQDGESMASDVTGRTGAFSLSVPYGRYTIAPDEGSGYDFVCPEDGCSVRVAPGATRRMGDFTATLSENGRPPRFTSKASFSVEDPNHEGEREIGTVTATDPDNEDAEITFAHAGGSENIEVYPTGDLVWKDPLPSYDSKTARNNVYKFTVEATSPGKVGPKTATQSITVTVTASGDLVVKLVVTPGLDRRATSPPR